MDVPKHKLLQLQPTAHNGTISQTNVEVAMEVQMVQQLFQWWNNWVIYSWSPLRRYSYSSYWSADLYSNDY
jgi:hypothetical protein